MQEPAISNEYGASFVEHLLRSYRQRTGCELLPSSLSPLEAASSLYHAPFVVLAHDTVADPLFTYANLAAQAVFEMPWCEIVGMPSRYSAEPLLREERQRLLERVSRDGYIDDYQGVRISRTGKRFMVRSATVWNVSDAHGDLIGQAATFSQWEALA